MIPQDPIRNLPLSLDQWVRSFEVPEVEDQLKLSESADKLQRNPIFQRVLSRLEAITVAALIFPAEREQQDEKVLMLKAIKALRDGVAAMASDSEYEKKHSKNQ